MAELTDDDLILGPVTYFKYPSTSEYETEHGYDIQKAKQETNMFDNSYNDYNQRIDYTSSPYFPPQDLHNYGEMCQSGYNQNVNMYPYKSDIKQESLNYCQNEPEQCHSPMPPYHPNISQHNSYQQHPIQNGDYWNNGGWPSPYMSPQNYPHSHCYQPAQPPLLPFMQNINESAMKKRGRKKKIKSEFDDNMSPGSVGGGNYSMDMAQLLSSAEQQQQQQLQNEPKTLVVKERRKHDRFNGMPEEEVSKRTLPDLLAMNLDIVIIGINPGLFAAYKGHHYAGPGNHFWKCLYMSGLTTEPLTADDDYKLLQCGIGFTNMVERATKGSSDLTRKEIRDGGQVLLEKLQKFKPKIAVFNGKLIFEVFSGKKEFNFGRQPDFVDGTNTYMWVMPSSSARCAQLPRASDKVPYYAALKKFRDYLNGVISTLDENDLIFQYCKLKPKAKEELVDIKEEPLFYEEFDEEDSNGGGTASGSSSSCSPFKVDLIRKKIKCEEKSKPSASELSAVGVGSPADGVVVKKKRGRPKKIRPELMNPQPVPPASAECDNSSPTSPTVAAPAASVDGTSSAVVTPMATPDATTITGNSKYFCQSAETSSSSPGCSTHLAEDISPSYQQNQFSSPSVDGGYYSQNSIESAFSTYDFHPSEIQSHLRSFLPSSKHESQCFLDE